MNGMLNKITVRGIKIGVVSIGLLYFAYLTYEDPKVWAINLILWPICLLVIFDRGHAKTTDAVYKAVKHLKGKSERADLILVLLGAEKLEQVKMQLMMLKQELPSEMESIEIANDAIESYLKIKPWWHR